MILTDNETKIDLLNNEAIAATIIGLLCERPDRPVTTRVHGDGAQGFALTIHFHNEFALKKEDAGFAKRAEAVWGKRFTTTLSAVDRQARPNNGTGDHEDPLGDQFPELFQATFFRRLSPSP